MDLTDWEEPNPGVLHVPATEDDWANVMSRYVGSINDAPLQRCVAVARENGARTVVTETRYLGHDYRSEYTHFYSRTFAPVPDSAHRLHFFSAVLEPDHLTDLPADSGYLGYAVVRPSQLGAVARAVLRPPPQYAPAVRTAVTDTVHLFGQALTVTGVPFTQQDTRLGACAHASAWMCHAAAALRGEVLARPTGEFATEADSSLLPERALPTSGLTVAQLSDLLRRFGLPPMFYMIGRLPDVGLPTSPPPPVPDITQPPGHWDTRIIPTVCRHLNGGFPVLVGTRDHAFILCGWWREGSRVRLLRHDDQQGPYLPVDDPLQDAMTHPQTGIQRNYGPWVTLHVPMPGKAWLLPESAERTGGEFLFAASTPYAARVSASLGTTVKNLTEMHADGGLAFKTYVTNSNNFKAKLQARGWSSEACALVRRARMPRYVVVVEAHDRIARDRGAPSVLGEVVFDATSPDVAPEPVAAYLHGVIVTYSASQREFGPFMTDPHLVASGAAGVP